MTPTSEKPVASPLSASDREARSQLMQLLRERRPLVKGGLVEMARVCGKPGCRCARGEKHCSLYLSARVGKVRKMIYIPADLEKRVRRWLEDGRRSEALLEEMSQATLATLAGCKARISKSAASGEDGKR